MSPRLGPGTVRTPTQSMHRHFTLRLMDFITIVHVFALRKKIIIIDKRATQRKGMPGR